MKMSQQSSERSLMMVLLISMFVSILALSYMQVINILRYEDVRTNWGTRKVSEGPWIALGEAIKHYDFVAMENLLGKCYVNQSSIIRSSIDVRRIGIKMIIESPVESPEFLGDGVSKCYFSYYEVTYAGTGSSSSGLLTGSLAVTWKHEAETGWKVESLTSTFPWIHSTWQRP